MQPFFRLPLSNDDSILILSGGKGNTVMYCTVLFFTGIISCDRPKGVMRQSTAGSTRKVSSNKRWKRFKSSLKTEASRFSLDTMIFGLSAVSCRRVHLEQKGRGRFRHFYSKRALQEQ
jgi:hypothetical protein